MISPVGTSEINKRSGDVFLRKKKNLNPVFVCWVFLKCGFKKWLLKVLRTVALF